MSTPICDFVRRYRDSDAARLHMPGHKGKPLLGFEPWDITEIDGADELFTSHGIIAESEAQASALFGAHTVYSTGGSTLCIQTMLHLTALHAASKGERPCILAARNAHKAFVNAAALLDIDIRWLYPETDSGYDLFDDSVPFYQMVFSGDRQLVSRALNTSGDDRRAFLDCLAAGMVPHYELLPETLPMPGKEQVDGFYAADYADWGDAVIAGYQQYLPVYDAVFGQALVNYRQLRTGVCELTYENGTKLLVNRTETAETADGCTVAANGFTLIRAAA